MTRLHYRPIDQWPGELRRHRKPSPFEADWGSTLRLLDTELYQLHVGEAVLQLALTESDFRLDGTMRAGARVAHPGVVLTFEHPKQGPLRFACDRFERGYRGMRDGWRHNVRAVALGLEALRKINRYGISTGAEQYAGWKQLGAGIPMGPAMTVEDAARYLADQAVIGLEGGEGRPWGPHAKGWAVLVSDPDEAWRAYRLAAKRLHPDAGGSTEAFQQLDQAYQLLQQQAGR